MIQVPRHIEHQIRVHPNKEESFAAYWEAVEHVMTHSEWEVGIGVYRVKWAGTFKWIVAAMGPDAIKVPMNGELFPTDHEIIFHLTERYLERVHKMADDGMRVVSEVYPDGKPAWEVHNTAKN